MLKQSKKWVLFLLFGWVSAVAYADALYHVDIQAEKVNVADFLSYFEDGKKVHSIESIEAIAAKGEFKRFNDKVFNAGYSSSNYWLHFSFQIDDPENKVVKRYLEIDYALLGELEIYQRKSDGSFDVVKTGLNNLNTRELIRYSAYLYPVFLMANSPVEFYIKASSYSSVTVPIYLWQPEIYLQEKSDLRLFYGVMYGVMFAMCFYNLFLFFAMKESCYLHYSLYVIAITSIISSFNGVSAQYFFHDYPWLSERSSSISGLLAIFFSCQFTRGFLHLKTYSPTIDRVLNHFSYFMLPMLPVICSSYIRESLMPVLASIPLVWGGLSLWGGVVAWRHKVREARFYVVGWSFLLSSVILFVFAQYNIIPVGLYSEHGFQLGAVLEAIVFCYALADRTHIIQLERVLLQKSVYKISERSNKIKDEFLATISHEFRTPMNGVLGALQMLRTVDVPKQGEKYMEIASQSAADMMQIIDDILNFTEVRSGSLKLKNKKFGHLDMLNKISWLYRKKFDEKGVGFKTEFSERVDQIVAGDIGKIEQVLIQVLDNALKFTHQGGVTFKVSGSLEEDGKKIAVTYTVSDSGVGIAEDRVEQVYEAFRQQDSSNTRAYGGLGIGLAISRRLVELMGGTINFAGNDGGGTVFEVSILLDICERSEKSAVKNLKAKVLSESESKLALVEPLPGVAASSTAQTPAQAPAQAPVQRKILVVEDNRVNQMILKAILKNMGHKTVLAANGKEAVELLEHEEVDAILMDCQMPIMDGYEATREIRCSNNFNCNKPILAVTANVMANDREKCLNSGMNDYIKKPVGTEIVKEKLEHWLSLASQSSPSSGEPRAQ